MSSAEEEHLDGTDTPAEFSGRVTQVRFADEIEGLLEYEPYSSRARIEVVAGSLGISATAIAAELKRRMPNGIKLQWKPFTEEEMNASCLTPPFLVDTYLYPEVAVFAAPGGSSKTTLAIWEAIHIALGLPLYGLRTSQASTLYVTAEDSREVLGATLRELMAAMDLSEKIARFACRESLFWILLVGPSGSASWTATGTFPPARTLTRLLRRSGTSHQGRSSLTRSSALAHRKSRLTPLPKAR